MTAPNRSRARGLIACFLLVGCNTSTAGGLIAALPVQVGGIARDAGIDTPYVIPPRSEGTWQVELDQAVIAVGPFYFNIQPPETQSLQSGVVIVQFTHQVVLDVLDPTLYDAGIANGETGEAVSVEVDLLPPDFTQTGWDTAQSETYTQFLGTSSAYVAGVASRRLADGGAQVLPFDGFITIDSSLVSPNDPGAKPLPFLQRANEGLCPTGAGNGCVCSSADSGSSASCSLTFTTQPSVLRASVDPATWFASVDFSTLLPPPVEGDAGAGPPSCPNNPNAGWPGTKRPLTWCLDSSFNAELVNGLHSQTGAYLFSLIPLDQ